jgi:hypothetical protein
MLKISQEASSIAASSQQVSTNDLITNKRTITTNVMVEDGGIIVLGGLISDEVRESKSQVPFLGSIPIIGELFKTRSVDKVKTNLMVFIRPRILRDGTDAAIESNAKYNYIRDQQSGRNGGRVPLMPSERQPTLPPLEQLVPPELLNPARQAAPQGATAAERLQGSSSQEYYLPSDPTTGITNPAPPAAFLVRQAPWRAGARHRRRRCRRRGACGRLAAGAGRGPPAPAPTAAAGARQPRALRTAAARGLRGGLRHHDGCNGRPRGGNRPRRPGAGHPGTVRPARER